MSPDLDWQFREGRDKDGDRFAIHALVHGSGRVLAKVFEPSARGGFYCLDFLCVVPSEVIDASASFQFIELAPAKALAEDILGRFDPLARPAAKAAEVRERETA